MRARTAALRPSPPPIYQEMNSLPTEKLGGGKEEATNPLILFQNHPYIQGQAASLLLEDTQGIDVDLANFPQIADELGNSLPSF